LATLACDWPAFRLPASGASASTDGRLMRDGVLLRRGGCSPVWSVPQDPDGRRLIVTNPHDGSPGTRPRELSKSEPAVRSSDVVGDARPKEPHMTQYMLSVHSVDGQSPPPMTPEDVARVMKDVGALEDEMKTTGTWLFGGRLHEAGTATVVRADDGEVLTTDGPFVEAKEHLAGFYLIEAPDLDAALQWARRVSSTVGAAIEVRPLVPYPGT
jgi:hypothetical protein